MSPPTPVQRRAGGRGDPAPKAPRSGGLLPRLVAYSLGSAVAATCGELAFIAVYGWLGAGNVAASAAGFVGGAIPNYVVNRQWVWGDRRGRRPASEAALYWGVAGCSFGVSVLATDLAEDWARSLSAARSWQVLLVAAAYLGVAGVFFVAKFALFHLVVFTATTTDPVDEPGAPAPSATRTTTSRR